MAWEIGWTDAAWTDLEAAAGYIEKDSPHYAAAFVREVRDAAGSLRHFPERGRVVPEFDDTSIRELFVRNYRLIYRRSEKSVYALGSSMARVISGDCGKKRRETLLRDNAYIHAVHLRI